VSGDRTRTFLLIDLLGDEQTKIETFLRLQPAFAVDDLSVQFGGLIPTNHSVFETIRSDLTRAELLAFPLTALVVFLVFGSPASVAVLLAAGVGGVLFAFAALRGIVVFNDVSIFAINTIMLLGLGLAVDYSLFLVNRFREELPARGVDGAILRTMETTGGSSCSGSDLRMFLKQNERHRQGYANGLHNRLFLYRNSRLRSISILEDPATAVIDSMFVNATGSHVPLQLEKILFLTNSNRLRPGRVPLCALNLMVKLDVLQVRQLLNRSRAEMVF